MHYFYVKQQANGTCMTYNWLYSNSIWLQFYPSSYFILLLYFALIQNIQIWRQIKKTNNYNRFSINIYLCAPYCKGNIGKPTSKRRTAKELNLRWECKTLQNEKPREKKYWIRFFICFFQFLQILNILRDMPERKISKFLRKLFGILENEKYEEVISWDSSGQSVIIKDQARMESEIIPVHFSLRKFSSFVRQLHLYDFHKEKSKEYVLVFTNSKFKRDHRDLAHEIIRKRKTKAQMLSYNQDKTTQKSMKSYYLCEQLQQTLEGPQKQGENLGLQPSLAVIVLKSYSKFEDVERDPDDFFNFLEI